MYEINLIVDRVVVANRFKIEFLLLIERPIDASRAEHAAGFGSPARRRLADSARHLFHADRSRPGLAVWLRDGAEPGPHRRRVDRPVKGIPGSRGVLAAGQPVAC